MASRRPLLTGLRGFFRDGGGILAAPAIGRRLVLTRAIKGGQGRVSVNGHRWLVRGTDLPRGTVVEVVGTDGVALLVQPVAARSAKASPIGSPSAEDRLRPL